MISNRRSRWQPWVRIGWALVAITSFWAFAGILALTRQFADAPPDRIAAGLQALQWNRDAYFWFTVATTAPMFVGNFVVGAIIFWQRPNDWMAVFSSIFLISFAASNSLSPTTEFLAVLAAAPPGFRLPYFVIGIMSFGTVAVFLALFPDGNFVPKWMRWIALLGFLHALAWGLFPDVYGDPSGPFRIIQLGVSVIIFGGSMVAQIWRYRNYATPTQKQQTKWFLYGLGLSIGLQLMLSAIPAILPPGNAQTSVSSELFLSIANMSLLFIPLSFGRYSALQVMGHRYHYPPHVELCRADRYPGSDLLWRRGPGSVCFSWPAGDS